MRDRRHESGDPGGGRGGQLVSAEEKWTYHDLYKATREMLRQTDGENAEFTARQIVAAATDRSVSQLVADFPLMVFRRDLDRVNALARRHLKGEPLAYILGQWEFHGLTLTITPDVLIPRDDTEALAELAISRAMQLPQNPRVLDLRRTGHCGPGQGRQSDPGGDLPGGHPHREEEHSGQPSCRPGQLYAAGRADCAAPVFGNL